MRANISRRRKGVKASGRRLSRAAACAPEPPVSALRGLALAPQGARTFDFGYSYSAGTAPQGATFGAAQAAAYDQATTFEYGQARERRSLHDSPVGNARKCNFCEHRVLGGQLPACVTTCIGRATMFDDSNDPQSLVSELLARPNVTRLKEELGTEPRVFYLQ